MLEGRSELALAWPDTGLVLSMRTCRPVWYPEVLSHLTGSHARRPQALNATAER